MDARCCGNKFSPTTYLFTNSSIVFTLVQSSFPATGQRLSSLKMSFSLLTPDMKESWLGFSQKQKF